MGVHGRITDAIMNGRLGEPARPGGEERRPDRRCTRP
ncbi:hypothetical protein Ae505Ps2_0733c [Pseudonocardia sp. Ae505_Ps2]|nr:hypothetical protein Ae331Ps2_1391c [Pseudonocardia sp. Ae331_Ps2]OLM10610.1 hypothetical protein Ae505Ps2_0733c [Pseudonocardia sp. Ae505_Ps2]